MLGRATPAAADADAAPAGGGTRPWPGAQVRTASSSSIRAPAPSTRRPASKEHPMTPIPAWPDSATPEGKTFFANAKAILAAWRAKGVGNPFAFGMLAQGEAESSLDPNAKGDHVKGEPTA